MAKVFEDVKGYGNLDYVSCWYNKVVAFIQGIKNLLGLCFHCFQIKSVKEQQCRCCRSISSCRTFTLNLLTELSMEQLIRQYGSVHVIIVSLSQVENLPKIIFDSTEKIEMENINAYLLNVPNGIIEPSNKPLKMFRQWLLEVVRMVASKKKQTYRRQKLQHFLQKQICRSTRNFCSNGFIENR